MAAKRKTSKKKTASKRAASKTPPTLAEKIEQMPDLSDAAFLLADAFADHWDIRPGARAHDTVLRDAWERIWESGGKVKRTIRLLDQVSDGTKYDMDDAFVSVRISPAALMPVGKRLASAYVNLVSAQQRYWRVRPTWRATLRFGFLKTSHAPKTTAKALATWKKEQAALRKKLTTKYQTALDRIMADLVAAAGTLEVHVAGLNALFARIRQAEEARLLEAIQALAADDPRKAHGMVELKTLVAESRKLEHFRRAPSRLFFEWKKHWFLPRTRLARTLGA